MLGRELEEVFPVAFLPENHALAVAIMSYNGGIDFGLLADYDSMEDVEEIAAGLTDALAELEEAAAAATAGCLSGKQLRRIGPTTLWGVALLVVLFIVVPIAELYVIIQVGSADRRLGDAGAAARRRPARLAAAAPPGPWRWLRFDEALAGGASPAAKSRTAS